VKVLLTGANGFVGSHILDQLLDRGVPTVALLRHTASLRWIQPKLDRIEIRWGSVTDGASLPDALRDVTHVIHCAGVTKAVRRDEFHRANQLGTRALVDALNQRQPPVQRLVAISSLAASHPGTDDAPANEDDPPGPVTEYGRSKLAGELEIQSRCRVPFVILRPAAVYGPRDRDFLHLFRAVRSRFVPLFGGGRQQLSLVYARDVAEIAVATLEPRAAEGQIFNVAAAGVVTARTLVATLAHRFGRRIVAPALPTAFLWPVCATFQLWARLASRPHILSLEKYAELAASGWVCRVDKLREVLGLECRTTLEAGLDLTLSWYRREGWI
jgi:nucleoside-diphosphate-sugar epimerase